MTDEEMAKYLCIDVADMPKIDAKARAAYESMADFEMRWNLFQAGVGPKPTDSIVCYDHKHT